MKAQYRGRKFHVDFRRAEFGFICDALCTATPCGNSGSGACSNATETANCRSIAMSAPPHLDEAAIMDIAVSLLFKAIRPLLKVANCVEDRAVSVPLEPQGLDLLEPLLRGPELRRAKALRVPASHCASCQGRWRPSELWRMRKTSARSQRTSYAYELAAVT